MDEEKDYDILPCEEHQHEIVEIIKSNRVCVILGETGISKIFLF